jgi:hypothetical protein
LERALAKIEADRKEREKLAKTPLAPDFYPRLRKLEGADFDSPFNFVWNIDYADVFTPKPVATLAGEMALVNEAQDQTELVIAGKSEVRVPQMKGGFDLVVGNPPFVTARNPVKRELYRQRWPRVAFQKYLLLSPFFELSFGLLRQNGRLGFIASNAFAKREFGKPLIEEFFPTVDLQKIVDCSGLMFPGHGTPTCIVFGAQRKPKENSPIRVAAIQPGGGDLRTPPEESPLWHTLAAQHDNPGFENDQVVVSDRNRKDMAKWPWNLDVGAAPTKNILDANARAVLRDYLAADVGFMFVIGRNDIFMLSGDVPRRLKFMPTVFRALNVGDEIRNYQLRGQNVVLFPYRPLDLKLITFPKGSAEARYFAQFQDELSQRPTFAGSFADQGRAPYQYHQLPIERAKNPRSLAFAQIATHLHLVFDPSGCAFNEKAPIIKLPGAAKDDDHHVFGALLNSAAALFWLKQVCFSKRESEEGATDTYFEFAGGKVQQLPVPAAIADALGGESNALAGALTTLARGCWERGRELPSLRKLFEKPNEAYHGWNAALPGYMKPHNELGVPFSSTVELEARFASAREICERLRREMIARQEEMDWLVYAAYGLIDEAHPVAAPLTEDVDLTLDREDRPFRLYAKAGGDLAKALALIPADWSAAKKKLWRTRLEAIRDNEHIRRIEQPVYKRRWDEQWKVGSRWECGPVAYAQELIDAFTWWLSEKAEWHLEHKAKAGPIALPDWSAALFKDTRVAAAWPVIADTIYEVEKYKFDALDEEKKENRRKPKADNSYTAFERFFRDTILDQSVAHGIPPAKPWNELAEKKKWTPAQMKKAQTVRGKLNVPRERFQQMSPTHFVWAGT